MFICTLCNGDLSGDNQEILGTIVCGHIFHRDCLDKHVSNKSPLCPTCHKSLEVDLTPVKSGYAVLLLHPHEDKENTTNHKNNSDSVKDCIAHENAMLKRKLLELIQMIIAIKKENKDKSRLDLSFPLPHESDGICNQSNAKTKPMSNEPIIIISNSNTDEKGQPQRNFVKYISNKKTNLKRLSKALRSMSMDDELNNNVPEESMSYVTATENLDLLTPDLVALWSKPFTRSLSEEEKNRIFRSKRREYLTWRNKAQSWLSKMEIASQKLLETELSFTVKEYRQELRSFFNKIYNQGEIVDSAKHAAVVYLIMDENEVSKEEREEVHSTILNLTKSYSGMMTRIIDQLNRIGNENAYDAESDKYPRNRSFSSERCSSLSEEEDERQANTVVSRDPTSFSFSFSRQLSSDDQGETFTTTDPVFV